MKPAIAMPRFGYLATIGEFEDLRETIMVADDSDLFKQLDPNLAVIFDKPIYGMGSLRDDIAQVSNMLIKRLERYHPNGNRTSWYDLANDPAPKPEQPVLVKLRLPIFPVAKGGEPKSSKPCARRWKIIPL